MPKGPKGERRPADVIGNAVHVMRIATGQIEDKVPSPEQEGKSAAAVELGRLARAAPDGNTLLVNAPYLLIGPQVRKLTYDPLTSFEPICYLVVRRGSSSSTVPSPYRTLADLIDAVGAFTVSPLLCFVRSSDSWAGRAEPLLARSSVSAEMRVTR